MSQLEVSPRIVWFKSHCFSELLLGCFEVIQLLVAFPNFHEVFSCPLKSAQSLLVLFRFLEVLVVPKCDVSQVVEHMFRQKFWLGLVDRLEMFLSQ